MRILPIILLVFATQTLADTREQELSYLAPIMSDELAEYAEFQVPAIENLEIISEGSEQFLELRMFENQPEINNGYRAEVSVDIPYEPGNTVVYQWRMRIPANSEIDMENRWWILGQWHDQPDPRIGETWDSFPLKSPSVLVGYGHIDGHDVVSLAYGAPDLVDTKYIPLSRDVWHDMRMVIHWSMDGKGWAQLYMDDLETPFAEAEGRNMHNSFQHFMKLGMYRHPDIQVNSRIQLDDISIHIAKD